MGFDKIYSAELTEKMIDNERLSGEIIKEVYPYHCPADEEEHLDFNYYVVVIERLYQTYEEAQKQPVPTSGNKEIMKKPQQIKNPFLELRNKIKKYRDNESVIEQMIKEETVKKTEIREPIYIMARLKNEATLAYKALCKAIDNGLVELTDKKLLNFKCSKGCVGLFFKRGFFTDYKSLAPYILINGEEITNTTLKDGTKNAPPKDWQKIEEIYFN